MHMRILLVVSLCLAICGLAWSQETRGTISGKISDPSGAVIPGASVVVTNTAMGTKVTLETNQGGFYEGSYLIPGMYQIEAAAPGFKKVIRGSIEVRVADRLEVNLALELGASEQSVTVTAETPLLNTQTASLGTVVDAKRVADMPLEYGNPFLLIGAVGGVSFTGEARLNRPFEGTHIVGYAMAGSRRNLSDVTLDGAPTSATANANQVMAAYVPPTDIVAEFKVQTTTFDAQFGQNMGGVVNISLKSGTNALHGSASYSFQRPDFWANDFFNNSQGKPKVPFSFDRWGGSLGGPAYLPKLYNGKNRSFFMWGYEGIHDSRPRHDDATNSVPTPAMKTGDFSALLKVNSSYQVYNPFTRTGPVNGRYTAQPFPNNIIPPSLFNPVGKAILAYYPNPSSPDTANPDGTNNMVDSSVAEKVSYYNHSWRVDHTVSDKQRIFARVSIYRRWDSTCNDYFRNIMTGIAFAFLARAAVFDDVYMLSPSTVLNTRYSYSRLIRFSDGNVGAWGFDLTKLGFPASYANQIPKDIARFPRIDLTGYISSGFVGENRPVNNHTVTATLTRTHGLHSIRTGFEFRAYQEIDKFFSNDQTGRFVFDPTWTRGPLDNSPGSPGGIGLSVAALLLGLPSPSSYVTRAADYAEQSNSWGFFVQDDWKATKRLTLNLGLRYEFEQPLHERYNKSVLSFDFNYVQPFSAAAQAAYAKAPLAEIPASQFKATGGLTFAGVGGNPSNLYHTPKKNFMPRLGLAYQIENNTVLRGGFGVFYGFLGERRGDVIQSGFSQNTNMVPTIDNINFIATLSNPFPNGIQEPAGAAGGPQTFLGQNISFFNQYPKVPRVTRWSLGLQRVFKGGVVVQVDYTGNKTIHIEIPPTGNPPAVNLNALPNQYLGKSPLRDNATNNYLTGRIPNPFYGLGPAGNTQAVFTNTTVARSDLLVPYPQFGQVSTTTNTGYSWYHALLLNAEKRFSKGFSLAGNYTFSKFMQADELLNPADPYPVRVISDQDVPHRFSVSGVMELPLGKNKPFLSTSDPVASRLVGGWRIAGIWGYQVGLPLQWSNPGATLCCIYYGDPKNILLPADQRTVDHWFNTAGFERASANQLVSNQLRTWPLRFSQIRGRNANNVDLALTKNTRLKEGKDIQFRAEALNALNHPGFPAPVLMPGSASFGKIVASNQAGYPRRLQLMLKYIF
jgi:outer membrane receptor protein involved in Fe transport